MGWASSDKTTALLLTGLPGVGKTTVIRRVAEALREMPLRGFTTEEVRRKGKRVGFRLETFDGDSTPLAHVSFRSGPRVGRYGVDLTALERVVESALDPGAGAEVYLVDEIGKMECLSARFVSAMERLLDSGSLVVATVAAKGSGSIERVKRRRDVQLLSVTYANRDALAGEVLAWLASRRR